MGSEKIGGASISAQIRQRWVPRWREKGQTMLMVAIALMVVAIVAIGLTEFVTATTGVEKARSEVMAAIDAGFNSLTYGDQTMTNQGAAWGEISVSLSGGGRVNCLVRGIYGYPGARLKVYGGGASWSNYAYCWGSGTVWISGSRLVEVWADSAQGQNREIALEFVFEYPTRLYGVPSNVRFSIRRALSSA